jgi:hypothetical protein
MPPLFVSALREKIHNRATVKSLLLCGMGPHERVMEGTVLSLRIVTTSAIFLAFAAGSASAQTVTTAAPGRPLSLLQIYPKNEDAAAVRPHYRARYVRRKVARTHVANQMTGATRHAYTEAQPTPEPEQTAATQPAATPRTTTQSDAATAAAATTPAPANIWPGPDVPLPGAEALTPAPPVVPTIASNEPVTAANSNDLLTAAYHTVQVTPSSPAQATRSSAVNSTDIAADHQRVTTTTAGPNDATATWPVQRVMAVTAEPQTPYPIGSASWIAHVLAALVGAIATGALAWVLINPLPARSYE